MVFVADDQNRILESRINASWSRRFPRLHLLEVRRLYNVDYHMLTAQPKTADEFMALPVVKSYIHDGKGNYHPFCPQPLDGDTVMIVTHGDGYWDLIWTADGWARSRA